MRVHAPSHTRICARTCAPQCTHTRAHPHATSSLTHFRTPFRTSVSLSLVRTRGKVRVTQGPVVEKQLVGLGLLLERDIQASDPPSPLPPRLFRSLHRSLALGLSLGCCLIRKSGPGRARTRTRAHARASTLSASCASAPLCGLRRRRTHLWRPHDPSLGSAGMTSILTAAVTPPPSPHPLFVAGRPGAAADLHPRYRARLGRLQQAPLCLYLYLTKHLAVPDPLTDSLTQPLAR